MSRTKKLEEELLRLMGVRQQTHESIPGPFACRWCEAVVKTAVGDPWPGEMHEAECFAALHLKRPAREAPKKKRKEKEP